MKTVMKYSSLVLFIAAGFIVSGCYTELATEEFADERSYVESDTTYDDGNVIVNNNYYLDDDYRRSRMRVSFNYYYPTYHSSWIERYYNSYYDDYYWGWNRPWGWHHYYPGCTIGWWPPVYDPFYPYPYYPVYVYYPIYYPVYYPTPGYADIPKSGRPRDNGPTRDPRSPEDRTRPVTTPAPGTVGTPGTTVAHPRPALTDEKTNPVVDRPRREPAWWERQKLERAAIDGAERPRTPIADRQSRPSSAVDRDTPPPSVGTKPEARPTERNKKSRIDYTAPPKSGQKKEMNNQSPQRPRDDRRSYTPPQTQQAPPASAAPRGGGSSSGSSGSSGGSRKRGE